MKIINSRVFQGRNIYTHKKCIRLNLDLEGSSEIPSKKIDGFNETLVSTLPELTKHRCGIDEDRGFIKRLTEGTYLAHVSEHIIIARLSSDLGLIRLGQTKVGLSGEGELFATLRLITQTPCSVTKGGRAFRHIATRDANSSNVDPDGWNPDLLRCLNLYVSIRNTEKTTSSRASLFVCLPGDTIGGRAYRHTATHNADSSSLDPTFPGARPQVSSALERKADELFATLRLITQTPCSVDP